MDFDDMLRLAIMRCGKSRYWICKRINLDQSTMSRFINGKGGLSIEAIRKLFFLLNLKIV